MKNIGIRYLMILVIVLQLFVVVQATQKVKDLEFYWDGGDNSIGIRNKSEEEIV